MSKPQTWPLPPKHLFSLSPAPNPASSARLASVPAEGDVPRPVSSFLHQRLVELAASPGVDGCPAVLTVVLQAGHVCAEERGKLATAASALTLVTQLVIQDIWLDFHLRKKRRMHAIKKNKKT